MGTTRIQRIRFKKKIIQLIGLMLAPSLLTTFLLLIYGNFPNKIWITALAFSIIGTFIFSRWLLVAIFRPLQSASNLVSAIREGDFSMQSRPSSMRDPLGELYHEINLLITSMQQQHQKAVESEVLLRVIMDLVDVSVFAFDGGGILTLVNRAGCDLLKTTADEAIGKPASHYKLQYLIEIEEEVPFRHTFPAQTGRWSILRTDFRENGVPHVLIMLNDLSKSLREEERTAWKRLIRVMGHELNNSLAPIKSISGTLNTLIERGSIEGELKEDLEDGLHVIHKRADALSRFVNDYSKIAKLPPPSKSPFSIRNTIKRIVGLQDFKGCSIKWDECCDLELFADEPQIEQMLINLTKNAIEANQQTQGKTMIRCTHNINQLYIEVMDEGLGLASTDNLFIPFYSTKPGGSGIGLTLSQQIAENHEGSLELKNRPDSSGCVATVVLPCHHSPVI